MLLWSSNGLTESLPECSRSPSDQLNTLMRLNPIGRAGQTTCITGAHLSVLRYSSLSISAEMLNDKRFVLTSVFLLFLFLDDNALVRPIFSLVR